MLLFSSSLYRSYYYSQTSNKSSIERMVGWNIDHQFLDERIEHLSHCHRFGTVSNLDVKFLW